MKKILFVIPVMNGGGAEKVGIALLNSFNEKGFETEIILTSQTVENAEKKDLNPETRLYSVKKNKVNFFKFIPMVLSSFFCKVISIFTENTPAIVAFFSFISNYHSEYKSLRRLFKNNKGASVIAFLQPAIPLCVLAARGLDLHIIISERGDARRLMKHRYGSKFISKYYQRADKIVFQTEEAKNIYPDNISKKGCIISNPVRNDLPLPYSGVRNKTITTFCRISVQKNIPLLIEAYTEVNKIHPEFKLRIIGKAFNKEDENHLLYIKKLISDKSLENSVIFEDFSTDVHNMIIKDYMYVNSSDYEGISNAMLESMAIGLPVVCTDCPVGGARQTIEDEINGLLVPCGDKIKLAGALNRLIENPSFCEKLSLEELKIKDKYSLDRISQKWIELL